MNRRGRSRFGGSPEIYYYNSARRDAVGELAGQLSGLIQEEMTRRHKKKLVFLCIGTFSRRAASMISIETPETPARMLMKL